MELNQMQVQMEVNQMEVDIMEVEMEVEMQLPYNEDGNVEFTKDDCLVEDHEMDLSEVSNGYCLGFANHNELSHCLQRAEALIQVLGEAAYQNGNDHQGIQIEIIEEYLLEARKILEQTKP